MSRRACVVAVALALGASTMLAGCADGPTTPRPRAEVSLHVRVHPDVVGGAGPWVVAGVLRNDGDAEAWVHLLHATAWAGDSVPVTIPDLAGPVVQVAGPMLLPPHSVRVLSVAFTDTILSAGGGEWIPAPPGIYSIRFQTTWFELGPHGSQLHPLSARASIPSPYPSARGSAPAGSARPPIAPAPRATTWRSR